MQLQGRSCSTCAAGFSIAKRVKNQSGRSNSLHFIFTSYQDFVKNKLMFIIYIYIIIYTEKATPDAGKKRDGYSARWKTRLLLGV